MGFYNVVVVPCVVGKLHYARPTTAPIEVDDDVAAPLVESGCLEQYRPGQPVGRISVSVTAEVDGVPDSIKRTVDDVAGDFIGAGQEAAEGFTAGVDVDLEPDPEPKPRRTRKCAED